MRWRALSFLLLACLLSAMPRLSAQEAAKPFDMSPERGSEPFPLPAPGPAPAEVPTPAPIQAPAATAAPPAASSATPPAQLPMPGDTGAPSGAPPNGQANPKGKAQAPAQASVQDRPILPSDQLVLEGEIDTSAWNVVLTPDQAASPTTLTLGYRTAVLVAPETSRLNLLINNHLVLDSPIVASDHAGLLSVELPAGLLQPGPNLFRLQATQRHRTDCTISSTYELRTQIDGAATALHFHSSAAARLLRVEDLATVGPDTSGETHLRIVTPSLGQRNLIDPVMRFAQAASILIGMPNQSVSVVDKSDGPTAAGTVTAVIGTADDLRNVMHAVPAEADSRPIVTFVDDPMLGPSTLVISGPSVAAVSRAVDAVAKLVDRPKGVPRNVLDTSRWFAPNPPLFLGAGRAKLSSLGVFTQEFSGRRFKTEFQIGIPSDFYAGASSEATLLLDAAYSGAVLPGSHLDIYINGSIAATTPLSTSGGEILRHLPIRIPMNHFRPGPNRITFEAQLHTAADAECVAGPSKGDDRFVLFDTSEFVMPDFARIAQLPNLAALQGTSFPYNSSDTPVALVLGDTSPDIVSAAATLLGRMAVAAGRIIVAEIDTPSTALDARNAIFVAAAEQIPADVPAQLNLDSSIRSAWKAPEQTFEAQPRAVTASAVAGAGASVSGNALGSAGAIPADTLEDRADTQETFNRWRERLSSGGGGWRGNVSAFQDWFQRTLQLSGATLRFVPGQDAAFEPPHGSTTLIAQGPSVSGDKTWTLITAPTPHLLLEGADALTDSPQWFEITGRVVSYSTKTKPLDTEPVGVFSFVPTQPVSLANLRLIAANWLSENILAFSLLLFAACVLLGLATALFLSRIGRRSSA